MKSIDKDILISDIVYKSLFGELSEDEQTILECWMQDPQNRQLYEELLQPEKLYDGMLERAEWDTGGYYRRLQRVMDHKRRIRLWLVVASVAAVLVLLVGMLQPFRTEQSLDIERPYQIIQQFPLTQTTLKTDEGEIFVIDDSIKQIRASKIKAEKAAIREPRFDGQQIAYNVLATSSRGNIEVTLSDSTKVWLNAGSRLCYPNQFAADKREVELTGEAYFEVDHNKQQPFIVKAGTVRIEVLGTQFNVKMDEGTSCITTLIKGSVKVRNKVNDTVVIHPGQQVNTPEQGAMTVKSVDTRFYTAWKRNRFAFQNEPLYGILDKLSEWYDCTFEFSRPELAFLHFTTIVPRYDHISQVLEVLQATREFDFFEMHDRIYITDYNHETNITK